MEPAIGFLPSRLQQVLSVVAHVDANRLGAVVSYAGWSARDPPGSVASFF
jgi:hypothetical protein